MNSLDMRTVIVSYAISNLICAAVMAFLWKQNRRRFDGLGFWLADFVVQFMALVLVGLRGVVPDFISMTVSNTLVIGGTLLLYIGLEHFLDKRTPQWPNYILLAVFVAVHSYFVFIYPSLLARNVIFSLGLLVICFQCAWLMLRRVDSALRPISRDVGNVFVWFCVISLARIVIDLFVAQSNEFFHSGFYDTLLMMTYQMLYIILTFALFLMVNRRLFVALDGDIAARKEAENALRKSEERYQTFLSQSFEAIYRTEFNHPIDISLPAEAQIDAIYANAYMAECNQAMAEMYHVPSVDALIGVRLIDAHGGSDNPINRAAFRKFIKAGYKSTNDETVELDTDGNPVWFLSNTVGIIEDNYLTRMWGTSINITERKKVEEALKISEEKFSKAFQSSPDAILISRLADGKLVDVNEGFSQLTEYTREEALLSTSINLKLWVNPQDREQVVENLQRDQKVLSHQYDFRTKSGRILHCLYSAQVIQLKEQAHLLSVVRDITEQNLADEIVRLRLRLWEYAATHTIEELMQRALDEIGTITSSPIGFYHFVSEDQNALSLQAWSTRTLAEFCKAEGRGMHYPISEAGVWVDCIHQRQPVIHNDYVSLSNRKGMPDGHAEVIRELVVPTMRSGRVVSILGVGNKPANYDQQDIEIVAYIADVIWTIVEQKRADEQIRQLNARLEQLAMTDELTRVANRRAFFMRGSEEIKRAQRYQTPLSLLMLDIDEFKLVNDTYGHDAGDVALKCVAKALQDNIRQIDLLARLGGEEFGILLPNTKATEAYRLAERLRAAIEKETCSSQNCIIRVTVSIGVAKLDEEMMNTDHLLKNADIAMYQAKNQGRNRVVYVE
jgi:diguanylate cyclase (GGDEF)-like protein/PAS domain S-box-containing protein